MLQVAERRSSKVSYINRRYPELNSYSCDCEVDKSAVLMANAIERVRVQILCTSWSVMYLEKTLGKGIFCLSEESGI